MPTPCNPAASPLLNEHIALCRTYAEAQQRCSRHMAAQRAELVQLQAQAVRLRSQVLVLTTALAWARADRVAAQLAGSQDEVLEPVTRLVPPGRTPCQVTPLESSLADANLVLCQVGCLSHGAYWRDEHDQCRRSGQTCVLVESDSVLTAAKQTFVSSEQSMAQTGSKSFPGKC